MAYSIQTRDGITLANIPDDWQPTDDRLKQLVTQRRQALLTERNASGETQAKYAAQDPSEYDPNSEAFQSKYGATSGMSGGEKAWANLGAGMKNAGLGAAQLVLPKAAERAMGITDESIQEKRVMDEQLADSTTGGRLLQMAGEAAPGFAVPGGAIAKGLGMLPKAGGAIRAAGIGSRALPTLAAEGAVLGGVEGAITPSTSEESVLGNTVMGAGTGAALPMALKGLGFAARPFSKALQQREVASKLGETLDVSPQRQRALAAAVKQSDRRIVDSPQSTAALTQDPKIAALELAARANPETAASWAQLDQGVGNARWKVLDDTLGSDETVKAAKAETDAYARDAIPEVFNRMDKRKLADGRTDFASAVQGRLNRAVKEADPASQEVYGYVARTLDQAGGSPRALWNIRKTLSEWIEGTPPPGLQGTRAAKIDKPIMETRSAIDEVLNRASGGKGWTRFLERYGEFAQKETQQKAGQNIRNTFFDETLVAPRGATTSAGNPAVTRARLEQALAKHGKNDFGETLSFQQRDAVDQVLSDLRADEILQRAKSSMTGKGGSQTAPLLALMKRENIGKGGHWFKEIAESLSNFSQKKQRAILNDLLQSPQDALVLIRQAEKMNRALSVPEQHLVYAARTVLASPAAFVLANSKSQGTAENGGGGP